LRKKVGKKARVRAKQLGGKLSSAHAVAAVPEEELEPEAEEPEGAADEPVDEAPEPDAGDEPGGSDVSADAAEKAPEVAEVAAGAESENRTETS
jgi:hypothetical protein